MIATKRENGQTCQVLTDIESRLPNFGHSQPRVNFALLLLLLLLTSQRQIYVRSLLETI